MPDPEQTDVADAAPEPPPAPDISALLAAIQVQLGRDSDRAAARERIIDRLHEENQQLRSGEHRLLLRPVLTDLQRLRNDLIKQAGSLHPGLTPDEAAELLISFAYSVELILDRAGVQVHIFL